MRDLTFTGSTVVPGHVFWDVVGYIERGEIRPVHAAAVRLLLLTGCRKSEILTLQWRCYREGNLHLSDSKTGPRTVWLCQAARDVLDRLPRSSGSVFPVDGRRAPRAWLDRFWSQAREEAGIGDVRLHDLRHSCARAWELPTPSDLLSQCHTTVFPVFSHAA